MAKRTVLLLLWLTAVSVEECWCWGEEPVDNVNDRMNINLKVEEAKQSAADAMQDAKDKTRSWADWTIGTFSQGFKLNEVKDKETAHVMIDKTGDAASRATESMNFAASEASNYASEKACEAANLALADAKNSASDKAHRAMNKASDMTNDAKETMGGAMSDAKDRASNAYAFASEKADQAVKAASEKASGAKETMAGGMSHGQYNAYNEAKTKVGDAYRLAKETMTDQAKGRYEAAKEEASEATGNLGAKMRMDAEL